MHIQASVCVFDVYAVNTWVNTFTGSFLKESKRARYVDSLDRRYYKNEAKVEDMKNGLLFVEFTS